MSGNRMSLSFLRVAVTDQRIGKQASFDDHSTTANPPPNHCPFLLSPFDLSLSSSGLNFCSAARRSGSVGWEWL